MIFYTPLYDFILEGSSERILGDQNLSSSVDQNYFKKRSGDQNYFKVFFDFRTHAKVCHSKKVHEIEIRYHEHNSFDLLKFDLPTPSPMILFRMDQVNGLIPV